MVHTPYECSLQPAMIFQLINGQLIEGVQWQTIPNEPGSSLSPDRTEISVLGKEL